MPVAAWPRSVDVGAAFSMRVFKVAFVSAPSMVKESVTVSRDVAVSAASGASATGLSVISTVSGAAVTASGVVVAASGVVVTSGASELPLEGKLSAELTDEVLLQGEKNETNI